MTIQTWINRVTVLRNICHSSSRSVLSPPSATVYIVIGFGLQRVLKVRLYGEIHK